MTEVAGMKFDALAQGIHGRRFGQIARVDILDVIELPFDPRNVDRLAAATLFVLENEDRTVVAEQIDQLEPVLETFVRHGLVILAGVVLEQVQGTLGQKELVSSVIDFLPAEVPHIETKTPLLVEREFVAMDGYSLGRFVFLRQRDTRLKEPP